jgi:hypothetical protein
MCLEIWGSCFVAPTLNGLFLERALWWVAFSKLSSFIGELLLLSAQGLVINSASESYCVTLFFQTLPYLRRLVAGFPPRHLLLFLNY